MKARAILLLLIIAVFASVSSGQPLTEWDKTIGTTTDDQCRFIHELDDGGFFVAGPSGVYATTERKLMVAEINADGSLRWMHFLGPGFVSGYDNGCATSDGGYVMVGYQGDTPDSAICHAFKVNANGDSVWSRRYPLGEHGSGFTGVCEVPGGDLMMCGDYTVNGGDRQGLLVRTNSNGDTLWTRNYGDAEINFFRSQIIRTHDDYYLMAGETFAAGGSVINYWLVKVDGAGVVQFERSYGTTTNIERAETVVERITGDYLVGGSRDNPTNVDAWILLVDSDGDSASSDFYDDGASETCLNMLALDDGGVLCCNSHFTPGGPPAQDTWLVRANWHGAVQWTKLLSKDSLDTHVTLIQTSDGGFLLGGITTSIGAGGQDAWLTKLGDEGPHSLCIRPHWGTPHMKLFFKTSLPGNYLIYSTFDPDLTTTPPGVGWDLLETLTVVGAGNVSWDHDNALGSEIFEQRNYVVVLVNP